MTANGAHHAESALHGLQVLDLSSSMAGAWCSRLFGDFGADVTVVEAPAGHPLRAHAPVTEDGRGIPAEHVLANKRSLALDLEAEPGRRAAARSRDAGRRADREPHAGDAGRLGARPRDARGDPPRSDRRVDHAARAGRRVRGAARERPHRLRAIGLGVDQRAPRGSRRFRRARTRPLTAPGRSRTAPPSPRCTTARASLTLNVAPPRGAETPTETPRTAPPGAGSGSTSASTR